VLIARRDHPLARSRRVTAADLLEQPFVMPWEASRTRRHIEEKLGRVPRVALEAGRWESIKRYVAIGLGVALVPRLALTAADRRELAELRVGRLFEPDAYAVVTRAGTAPRAARTEFLSLLRARSSRG
jgi:DNA-binding transcriptional LysR family regulator